MSPKIFIDDRELEVGERENLIDAAARIGIHIPHFCYHPALSVAGNCRQCLVEVEGVPKPQIACNTPVKDGMRIRCQTPAIAEARRGVLEYLLLNHPIDCPICDQAGECRLQEYYMGHGLYDSRRNVGKVHKPKVVDLGPLVLLDAERCVLCSRCVRFCQEIPKVEELYIAARGHEAEIATFPGKQLENAYSGNVVDICPVGALLSRDFRFKSRVWWLKQADSVCASCARGCNMRIDHHWNQVQRLVPRTNLDVNQYWMCDRGRLNYRWINENRLTEARVAGRTVQLREALDTFCDTLRDAGSDITVLLSPKLANEELLVLRRLFQDVLGAERVAAGSLEPSQPEDEILRRADPHPSSWALQALKLDGDPRALLRESGTRVLVIVGDDPVGWDPELAAALQRADFVVALLTNDNATARAVDAVGGTLLPLATHAEFAGSFTNFQGRTQRFEPALSPWDSAWPGYEYGLEIAHTLGKPFWPRHARIQDRLDAIWGLLPAGTDLQPVVYAGLPQEAVVPVAQPTAQRVTKGYTPGEVVWRS
jgi:NADH-quinone oxidoreductase subunit G